MAGVAVFEGGPAMEECWVLPHDVPLRELKFPVAEVDCVYWELQPDSRVPFKYAIYKLFAYGWANDSEWRAVYRHADGN